MPEPPHDSTVPFPAESWNPVGADGLSPVWVVRPPHLDPLIARTWAEAVGFMEGEGDCEDDETNYPAMEGRQWTVTLERWPLEKLTALPEWSA
jgi:hypothetical protein